MNKGNYTKLLLASIFAVSCITAKAPVKKIRLITTKDVSAQDVKSAYKSSMVKGVFGTYLTAEAGMMALGASLHTLNRLGNAPWTNSLQDGVLSVALAYATKWLGGWTLEKYSEAVDNHMVMRTIEASEDMELPKEEA